MRAAGGSGPGTAAQTPWGWTGRQRLRPARPRPRLSDQPYPTSSQTGTQMTRGHAASAGPKQDGPPEAQPAGLRRGHTQVHKKPNCSPSGAWARGKYSEGRSEGEKRQSDRSDHLYLPLHEDPKQTGW